MTHCIRFVLLSLFVTICSAGTPAPAHYFHYQIIDHLNSKGAYQDKVWTQRYYVWENEFQGPGYPIFLILGGEGAVPPSTGLFYPFITHHLAKSFGGYVLEPEHRFYGESQPLLNFPQKELGGQDPRVGLLTSEQALYDAMYLLDHIQYQLGCSRDKFSPRYCPVITVGGSYPGWLSAMARTVFPHKVDMAYAASAPMTFYSQQVNVSAYYNHITKVAEHTISGCSSAVQSALSEIRSAILSRKYNESSLGICEGTIPKYISTDSVDGLAVLVDELMMVNNLIMKVMSRSRASS